MSELEKALHGLPYDSRDEGIKIFQDAAKKKCFALNHMEPDDPCRNDIMQSLVSGYNPYVFIEEGFHCVFGKNIHFQGMAMINCNCTFLDSNIITIGDRTLIGPGCSLICTNHAIDAEERLKGVFHNEGITIGNKVWLGANVTVLPGVKIGDRTVIGAGSVVTKDIPSDVIACGNPCKVVRKID